MRQIYDLITELCPDGVPSKSLSEIGLFYRGGGISKADLLDSGFPAVHYGQIYTKYEIWSKSTHSFIDLISAKDLPKAQPGDLLIAISDVTPQNVGKAFAWLGKTEIAVGGDVIIFRHEQDPRFVSYFFNSSEFFRQKVLLVTGATVRHLSAGSLGKIKMPLPPLQVQIAIADALDAMTSLQAELQAELAARQQQYEYYRNELLSTQLPSGVEYKTLGDLFGTIPRGKRLTKSNLSKGGSIPVFHGGLNPIGYHDESNTPGETVMIINTGASSGSVGWSQTPFWCSDGCFALPHSEEISARFLYYFASLNEQFFKDKVRKAGIPTLASASILSLPIPILPMSEQVEIVGILDKFSELTTDLSKGLPAEIEARRKQYEYYRDKLLTFKELAA